MNNILKPGYVRWDGTKFVFDGDVEIIGPPGPFGATGPQGPTGTPGTNGVTGARGATGPGMATPYYGNLFFSNSSGSLTITTTGTYYPIIWDTAGLSAGITLTQAAGTQTVLNAGTYLVNVSFQFERNTAGGDHVSTRLFKNGSDTGYGRSIININSTTQIYTNAFSAIITLAANDVLDVRCTSDTNGDVISYFDGNFTISSIGGGIGATGIQGITGATGPTGPQGPTGPGIASPYYGNLFFTNNAGSLAITNSFTYYPIIWDTAGISSGITLTQAAGTQTIINAGTYLVNVSFQFLTGTGPFTHTRLFKNGIDTGIGRSIMSIANSSQVYTNSFSTVITLAANDVLDVRCTTGTNGDTISYQRGNFTISSISGGIGATGVQGITGATGPTGPAGANAQAANTISFVDMASYVGSASPSGIAANSVARQASGTSNGNTFWQTSATATSSGGRFYWVYSGSGTDNVVIKLWGGGTNVPSVIASQTVAVTASGLYTFSWSVGTVSINPYDTYGITFWGAAGSTGLVGTQFTVTDAITAGFNANGAPPWSGTMMTGKNCNYIRAGIKYVGTGTPGGNGNGSSANYAPVEATIVP